MTSKASVEEFLVQRVIALVGVSRSGKGFGNIIRKTLSAKGYKVLVVHPEIPSIEGEVCYPSLSALPEPAGGVVLVVPPAETEKVVKEAASAGISRIWMQQGAESEAAIRFCRENGMKVVYSECVLMFLEDADFIHRVHRWGRGLLGRNPR
jgi:uncharacterized protein